MSSIPDQSVRVFAHAFLQGAARDAGIVGAVRAFESVNRRAVKACRSKCESERTKFKARRAPHAMGLV